jgi:hypothetical protein
MTLARLGFNRPVHLLDLWSGETGIATGSVTSSVLGHGVVMYKVWA